MSFELRLETTQPDVDIVNAGGGAPALITIEDNNGVQWGTPVVITIEDAFGNASTSLTLDELTKLRNMLNQAIVWSERELAGQHPLDI